MCFIMYWKHHTDMIMAKNIIFDAPSDNFAYVREFDLNKIPVNNIVRQTITFKAHSSHKNPFLVQTWCHTCNLCLLLNPQCLIES